MLQSTRFLRQLKSIVVKRLLQTLSKLAETATQAAAHGAPEDDADRLAFWRVSQVYNNVLKLGAIEDAKNRDKAAALVRFATNQRNETSLDQVRSGVVVRSLSSRADDVVCSTLRTGKRARNRYIPFPRTLHLPCLPVGRL